MGIFWSSSFGQNIPRVYSPRLRLENDVPAKKNKIFLQWGLGDSTKGLCFKVRVGLSGKGGERSRARQTLCPRAGIVDPDSEPAPGQDRGCQFRLIGVFKF